MLYMQPLGSGSSDSAWNERLSILVQALGIACSLWLSVRPIFRSNSPTEHRVCQFVGFPRRPDVHTCTPMARACTMDAVVSAATGWHAHARLA
eukprot:56357-Chlamydomonas_euryale.AAC.5